MTVRGWCPGLHDPMQSGDGWLARVRPPLARLTPAQAVALDRLATGFGNGIIEITSRGNLQVRGLSQGAALDPACASTPFGMTGAAPPDPRGFVDRACEAGLGQRDPVLERRRRVMAAPFADEALVMGLERALMATAALDALPPKFVFRVDGGAVPIVDVPAEVALQPEGSGVRITAGEVSFVGSIEDAIAIAPRAGVPRRAGRSSGPIGRVPGIDAVAVAPRFGQFGPGELAALAMRAGTALRVTPFRSVIVAGVPDGFADGLGLITEPDDPRLRIVACVGAPRCASGVGPAREVAEHYLGMLPATGVLHVSGCAKGCAYRGEARFLIPGRSPWP